jgi:hypothetical protein
MTAEVAVGKTLPVSTVYCTDKPRADRLLYRYVQGSTVYCSGTSRPAQAAVERIYVQMQLRLQHRLVQDRHVQRQHRML